MDLCDNGHEEIVYQGGSCPLCSANEEIGELEKKIGELETEVEQLDTELAEIQAALPEEATKSTASSQEPTA